MKKKGTIIVKLMWLFLIEVLSASIKLIQTIYTKTDKVDSRFLKLEFPPLTLLEKIIVAHFITLTPGTLSIDWVGPGTLLVHALHPEDEKELPLLVHKKLLPLLREWKNV